MQTLITRTGWTNHPDEKVSLAEGGVLKLERRNGNVDLISPAYWVAVVSDGSRVDWDTLVGQSPRNSDRRHRSALKPGRCAALDDVVRLAG